MGASIVRAGLFFLSLFVLALGFGLADDAGHRHLVPQPKEILAVAPEPIGPPREAPKEVEIEGVYEAAGKTAEGEDYRGILVTIRRRGAGFRIQWNVEEGLPAFGSGMRKGSELLVGFQPYGKNLPCVARYAIEGEDPKLVGRWMTAEGNVGEETLTWVRALAER